MKSRTPPESSNMSNASSMMNFKASNSGMQFPQPNVAQSASVPPSSVNSVATQQSVSGLQKSPSNRSISLVRQNSGSAVPNSGLPTAMEDEEASSGTDRQSHISS